MCLKSQYESQGFLIVPCLIPPEISTELEQACDRVISLTRSGSWKHRRTLGKQFPPWEDESPDSWGVQHVMHPELNEPVFAQWYTSDALLQVIKALLDCEDEHLQMGTLPISILSYSTLTEFWLVATQERFNLLINPVSQEFSLGWHRDGVQGTSTTDQEQDALNVRHYGVCCRGYFSWKDNKPESP